MSRNRKLFYISNKGRVVSVGLLRQIERTFTGSGIAQLDNSKVFASTSKLGVIEDFIYHVGFTWAEWNAEGFEVTEVST